MGVAQIIQVIGPFGIELFWGHLDFLQATEAGKRPSETH